MLGFAMMRMFVTDPYWRKPQPSTWDEIVRQRDGANSGASVIVYRSTQSDAPGTVINPRTRQIFEQKLSSPEDLVNFGITEDKELLEGKGKGKELLVIVKRGRAANIAEQDRPPYTLMGDIRQWAHGMTWAEIRRRCFDFLADDDEDDNFRTEKDDEVEVDSYKKVDEYEWNPFNP